MKNILSNLSDLFKKLQKKFVSLLNLLVSSIFYFLGIGLTKLVASLFGKNFIEETFETSAWKKKIKKINLEKKF